MVFTKHTQTSHFEHYDKPCLYRYCRRKTLTKAIINTLWPKQPSNLNLNCVLSCVQQPVAPLVCILPRNNTHPIRTDCTKRGGVSVGQRNMKLTSHVPVKRCLQSLPDCRKRVASRDARTLHNVCWSNPFILR